MDTHSNPYIIYGHKQESVYFPLCESIHELFQNHKENILKVKEYQYLEIGISGKNSKLYFDAFDIYNDECIKVDSRAERYIEDDSVILFAPYSNSDKENINNILVPGFYMIKIYINGKNYYSMLEILPKELEKTDWEFLLNDLENQLSGITQSLMNKNHTSLKKSKTNFNLLLDKIEYCKSNYSILIATLFNIKNDPKFDIKKSYAWNEKGKLNKLDTKSVKEMHKFPHIKEHVYSYKKNQNTYNKDNEILKAMLISIKENLTEIREQIEEVSAKIKKREPYFLNEVERKHISLETLKSYSEIINNYLVVVNQIFDSNWFKEINFKKLKNVSRYFLINRNYRNIYQLYMILNQVEKEYELSINYRNVWKRSDELYELWCLFKLLNIFGDIGFEYTLDFDSANIFDINSYDETLIQLTKGDELINVHFNTRIKPEFKYTNMAHPLYTSDKKNKPDIRLDFHIRGVYTKSIPIDVKYRNLMSLIKKDTRTFDQLKAYKDRPDSQLHLKESDEIVRKYHAIIPGVWIFYPGRFNGSHVNKVERLKNEDKMLFFALNPSEDNSELKTQLINEIEEMRQIVNR